MSISRITVAALALLGGASLLLAQQQPGPPQGPPGGRGPGGGPPGGGPPGGLFLPPYYTNKSAPLGGVDTAAADRACTTQGHAKLVCLADLLKKGMAPELLARLQLPYSVQDGRKWSNFPPMVYHNRIGVTLAEFSPTQLAVVKAILKESTGIAVNEGYDEIEQILNADDYLKENTGQSGFASGNFQMAFLGTPAAKGAWQLYYGGHHVQLSSTYKDGALAGATPSFRGVEPFTPFKEHGRDNAPMAQERDAFAAALGSLSPAEQTKARLSQTFTDIIVGPQLDNNFPSTKAGVRAGDLTQAQRELLLRAIDTYVGDIRRPDAATILAKYRTELADTWLSYSGTPSLTAENDYVRIDGPSVWIEFSMQPGRTIPGVHPHSVWRDRSGDYGSNK
ncbi:MAG TPA: DUF3500 domain-containing protein [Steroidobacteraceae bacterium]|nr:DUF3500 domain-containing protein [Steroidobacteraceae bacterium]